MNINDTLHAYLVGLYIPNTFTSADLATLIQHHLSTLSGDYTTRFLAMLAAAAS